MSGTRHHRSIAWIGLLVGLVVSWCAGAEAARWSQLEDTVFFNYSAEQGLPHGRVALLAEDHHGFLWMATQDGIHRWDGHDFERIPTGFTDVDADARAFQVDADGMLWIGTGMGLVRLDPVTRTLTRLDPAPDRGVGVLSVALEPHGSGLRVWLGTEEGIFCLDPETGRVERFLEEVVSGDRTHRVFALVLDRAGNLWAGTSTGLYRSPPDRSGFSAHPLLPERDVQPRIDRMIETDNGEIWLGTPRDGPFVVGRDGAVRRPQVAGFAQEWIYGLVEVSPGLIWLGTYGHGIIELDTQSGQVRRIRHNRLVSTSLSSDEIWKLYRSRSGLVWAGTSRGLSLHDPNQRALKTVYGASGRENGIRDASVKSILVTGDGRVWLGLPESGVDVLDPMSGRVAAIPTDPRKPDTALPGGAIEALAEWNGKVFIGSNWGLYQVHDTGVRRLNFDQRPAETFTGSLLSDGDYLWGGGTDGLWRFQPDHSPAISHQIEASINGEFPDPRISTLLRGSGEHRVIGTWNGIAWIDADGQLQQTLPPAGEQNPLANGYITFLSSDDRGRLWFGTSGGGIYIRDGDSLIRITRQQGLPSDVIGSLQADAFGRMWVSSSGGLAVIDRETLEVVPLGRHDGALLAPYYRQPGATTAQGEILFGGSGGLTVVRPDLWQPRLAPAPLVIVQVQVDDEPLADRQAGIDPSAPVIVPADRNALSVEFAGLDFTAPETLRYRYRMEGFDERWHETDSGHRIATYTALPPGSHTLRLEGSNRYGQWGGQSVALHVRVLPFWFQTAGARILLAVLAAALVAALLRWRTAHLQHRQVLLEEQIEASTAALREKSEALEMASMTDPLTGMHNRRFVETYIPSDASMAIRRYQEGGAEQPIERADLLFFLVDIDHFKEVNDEYGHQAGDAVLIEMRGRLQRVFRESDYLVRWGGEEFLVVARSSSRAHAGELAERIRQEVRGSPFNIGEGHRLNKTCSIGYVPFPFDVRHPEALDWLDCLQLADRALYAAKRARRDAWVGVTRGSNGQAEHLLDQLKRDPESTLAEGRVRLDTHLESQPVHQEWFRKTRRVS